MSLIGPFAKINQFATFRTEWSIDILGCPFQCFLTSWTGNDAGRLGLNYVSHRVVAMLEY